METVRVIIQMVIKKYFQVTRPVDRVIQDGSHLERLDKA